LHVCPLQYSSRTLPATQSRPGLLADKLSEVQMSYYYLYLCVCQYLWIIKFLEWEYRKKWGYFHRLGYWGFIIRLILLRFSLVFYINLPIRKSNRLVILGNVLGLDEWHLPICYQNPPFSWENACTKSGMCCFSVVPLSFLSVLSVFVDFPFWKRLGVRYHCYYLYSVVCQQIWRKSYRCSFRDIQGSKRPNTINFLFQILTVLAKISSLLDIVI
jgi:hypothetical protein